MEEIFKRLLERFENSLKSNNLTEERFSILGSPLKKANILILGNNWGGRKDIPNQAIMPKINDILDTDSKCKTYGNYLKFFTDLFESEEKALKLIENSVYTNACFIRTPNQRDYKKLLKEGFELSLPILKEIIDIVEPRIIIGFGNGNKSAYYSISKIFSLTKINWFKLEYIFGGIVKEENKTFIFLPHSSLYKRSWKINDSELFAEIRHVL